MTNNLLLKAAGTIVGTVSNIRNEWPHVVGDFEPAPGVNVVAQLFAVAAEYQKAKNYAAFDSTIKQIFQLGIELVQNNGMVVYKRTSERPLPGEIGIMLISDKRISFRIIPNLDASAEK